MLKGLALNFKFSPPFISSLHMTPIKKAYDIMSVYKNINIIVRNGD